MSKHKLIWTLQSDFPKEWISDVESSNFSIEHVPLIKLSQTKDFNLIFPMLNHKNIILTSPYSSKLLINKIGNKFDFFVVGNKAAKTLTDNGMNVIKTCNTSKELAKWIEKNSNKFFIHLCSEQTDKNLWPSNVSLIPFYKPIENKKFNYENYKNLDNSTVIFGSPSGVEVWFKNKNKYKKLNYACMGQTTADKIFEYTDDKVIFPKDSTISTLLSLVTESLNEKK